MALFPLIRQPLLELADLRRRQISQQLGQIIVADRCLWLRQVLVKLLRIVAVWPPRSFPKYNEFFTIKTDSLHFPFPLTLLSIGIAPSRREDVQLHSTGSGHKRHRLGHRVLGQQLIAPTEEFVFSAPTGSEPIRAVATPGVLPHSTSLPRSSTAYRHLMIPTASAATVWCVFSASTNFLLP